MTTDNNSARAERFLARIAEAYDEESMSPADHEYVEEVVYTMNLLDRLREEIRDGDLTERRTGGNRMRPEVVEARLEAQHLASLLRNFPDIEEA